MFEIILGVSVLLILLILFLIFRIYTLVNVVRGSDKKRATASNKVNALLMLLFLIIGFGLFIWYSVSEHHNYTIPLASDHGADIDYLFWITMAVSISVVVITHILLFWFSFRYQYKEDTKALYYPDNTKLEIFWTVIPAIVLSILVFSGWRAWSNITAQAPDNAEVVEVMGYQFAWKVRYPGKDGKLGNTDFRLIDAENQFGLDLSDEASLDDFSPREIHLPKGRPVLLRIRARDVLHSVYMPHFRMKMDAVPGMPTRFWFTPTKTTAEMRDELGNPEFNYELACAEICGRGHFAMRLLVIVHEPEDYDRWYAQQQPWVQQNPDYQQASLKGKESVSVAEVTE
jgi:cytochrome c oxidase subunit II